MMALVWTVIGIGLVAALLFGGASLFTPNAATLTQIKDNSTSAFQGMASAYQAYVNANDIPPTTADWQTQLVPGYLPELKQPVSGATWSYGYDATYGYYFCLSGSLPQTAWDGLYATIGNYPTNAFYLNVTSCTTRSTSAKPSSWPSTLYATYWLRGS